MMAKKQKKKKMRKIRGWEALVAWFRNSAGPMKDKKKDKKKRRQWKQRRYKLDE